MLLLAAATTSLAAPRIEVEPTTIDLGEMVRGEVRGAEFVVRNTGDSPLRIQRIDPG